MNKPAVSDYISLHFTIFMLGFTGIIGKLIAIPTLSMVFYRTGLAAITMFLILYLSKSSFKLSFQQAKPLLLTGGFIAIHWAFFFGSARISNVSISLAGFATQALFTSIVEPLFLKRKIQVLEVFLGLVAIIGIYVILSFEFNHLIGFLLGMASAVMSAFFSVFNAKLIQKYEAPVITLYEMIGACVGSLFLIPIIAYFLNEPINLNPSMMDWFWISILAIVFTVFPFSAMAHFLKKFSAFSINLSLNLETVYGIIIAYFVFGETEKMTAGFYIGTLIILLSVLVYPVLKKPVS